MNQLINELIDPANKQASKPASKPASKQTSQPATKQQASSSSSSKRQQTADCGETFKRKNVGQIQFQMHNIAQPFERLYILNYFESFWLPHSCFYNRCFKKISRVFVQTLLVITILVCQILPVVSFLFFPIVDPMAQGGGRKSHQLGKSHQNIKIPMC